MTEMVNKVLSIVQTNLVTKVFYEYLLQIFRTFSLKLVTRECIFFVLQFYNFSLIFLQSCKSGCDAKGGVF